MKNTCSVLIALLSTTLAAQPSAESVKELLKLSGSHQMVDMTRAQLVGVVNGPVQQALQGRELTPEVRAIVQACGEQAAALVQAHLSWEQVEPVFVEVYQATMTQEEVDGIVAFYKTPAGRAMVEKLPQLMQASGQRLQQRLAPLNGDLQALTEGTLQHLQAEFLKGL